MADIDTYLTNIKSAVYGEQVRSSIHDAIEEINNEVESWTELQDGTVSVRKLSDDVENMFSVVVGDELFDAYAVLNQKDAHVETTVSGGINQQGDWYEDATYVIDKYAVSCGEVIYVPKGDVFWQFQSNVSIPYRNNPNIVGATFTKSNGRFVRVPADATYLMVARESNSNYKIYRVSRSEEIKNSPNKTVTLMPADFIQGSWAVLYGEIVYNYPKTRIRTIEPIYLQSRRKLRCTVPSGYSISIAILNDPTHLKQELTWQTGDVEFSSVQNVYIICVFKKDGDATIKASEAPKITISKIPAPQVSCVDANNIITGFHDPGNYMDLDGLIKTSSSGLWTYSKPIQVNPDSEYYVWSFAKKDKLPENIYVIFFTSSMGFIGSVAIQSRGDASANTFTTPDECSYVVFSGNVYECKYLYVTDVQTYPMYFKHFSETTVIGANSVYNQKKFANIISWAKMGINTLGQISNCPVYPHGSKWAMLASIYEGFNAILIDVIKTSDGKFVISHDNNIAPFAKNNDGSSVTSPYNIQEHTLVELKTLDMGYDYGIMYRGTRIMTLEECLSFLKRLGVTIIIEPEYLIGLSGYEELANIVSKYGFREEVIIFSYYSSELERVKDVLPEAGLLLYAGSASDTIDNNITNAILLKNSHNKVIINAFAQIGGTYSNNLTAEQIQRMIDNGLYYSVSTPSSEPDGFINFMDNAPLSEYATHFGTQSIPASRMLMDTVL